MSAYEQFTTDRFFRDLYDRWATSPPEPKDEEGKYWDEESDKEDRNRD
jgi:hypothetical protein